MRRSIRLAARHPARIVRATLVVPGQLVTKLVTIRRELS
jgi:hypothetical protein